MSFTRERTYKNENKRILKPAACGSTTQDDVSQSLGEVQAGLCTPQGTTWAAPGWGQAPRWCWLVQLAGV
jgi:hypothetical protein